MKKYFFLFAASAILVSCKPRVEVINITVTPLRASSIYDAETVYKYMKNTIDTNKELAEEYYNKGAAIQVSDLTKAIYYFKRSLTIYPDYGHYKQLGDLLYEAKNYEEMNELYRLLVFPVSIDSSTKSRKYVFASPDNNMVCNFVVSNILAYNNVWNNKSDETELTEGLGNKLVDIKNSVLEDKRVKLSAPTEQNKNALWELLTADEKARYFNTESTSLAYKTFLEDTARVFEIDKNLVQQFDYGHDEGYNTDYEAREAMDEKYSKYIVGPEKDKDGYYTRHNFERNVRLNDSISYIIYSVDTSELASPKDMRNIYHRLVTYKTYRTEMTYKPTTEIIANKIIAVQSGDELSTVKYDHNKFTITYFKRYWEKPYVKKDFDNHLSKIEQTGEKSFEIKPNGKIKEISG